MRKAVATEAAPKPIGPYSQAIIHGGLAYLSGQIPLDPVTNQIVEGDIAVQTDRALQNLKALLEACGSSLGSVLKIVVFLKDMGDFQKMNQVYSRYFTQNPPARSAVQAARLPLDVRIEIDAIAAVNS